MTDHVNPSQQDRENLVLRLVEELPDCAIVALDVSGTVQTWNAGARSLLGYPTAEIVGRSFSYLCSPETLAGVLHSALRKGRHEASLGLLRRNGTRLAAQGVFFPLYGARDDHLGYGAFIHDLSGAAQAEAAAGAAELAERRQAAKILVVDDDDDVRQVAVRQLTSLGYRVVDHSNGADALKAIADIPDIALMFVDVVMPNGLGGKEVARRALEIRPDLRILFASGYFEGALASRGEIDQDVDFLVKPYRKQDLAEKIQQVLGTAGS